MKPFIFGISSTNLTESEKNLFNDVIPSGFIIFRRNIESKIQLKALCESFRAINPDALILIDQEGGRVQRLSEPNTKKYPTPYSFVEKIPEVGISAALKLCYDSNYEMAKELAELGINVNCTPVVDILVRDADKVIGDRSFGDDVKIIIEFSKQVIKAHKDAGINSVIKHIPGHGRANCDSHFKLPIITEKLEILSKTDFAIFTALADESNFAMTAHAVYQAIDPVNPATTSKAVISYIKNNIGFSGKLISDCITMEALSGTMEERAISCLQAGCDYVLHCSGNINQMTDIAKSL